jgi:hypothetical protein
MRNFPRTKVTLTNKRLVFSAALITLAFYELQISFIPLFGMESKFELRNELTSEGENFDGEPIFKSKLNTIIPFGWMFR